MPVRFGRRGRCAAEWKCSERDVCGSELVFPSPIMLAVTSWQGCCFTVVDWNCRDLEGVSEEVCFLHAGWEILQKDVEQECRHPHETTSSIHWLS